MAGLVRFVSNFEFNADVNDAHMAALGRDKPEQDGADHVGVAADLNETTEPLSACRLQSALLEVIGPQFQPAPNLGERGEAPLCLKRGHRLTTWKVVVDGRIHPPAAVV